MATKQEHDIQALVQRVSTLAHLSTSSAASGRFAEKVRSVLAYVGELTALDTSGIEPTSHAVAFEGAPREDRVIPSGIEETILAAAPERDGPYVQVPKVLDAE
jgi:aspartyl-tRNA(Asn)/glutamyl-tRNA(Gln) amidotransferase subunit C